MTNRQLYDLLVDMTERVQQTGFPRKMMKAAKTGKPQKVRKVFHRFRKQNYRLYKKIQKLRDFPFPEIFVSAPEDADGENTFSFSMSAIALYAVLFLAKRAEDDAELVDWMHVFTNKLEQEGYKKLGDYVKNDYITDPYPYDQFLASLYKRTKNKVYVPGFPWQNG